MTSPQLAQLSTLALYGAMAVLAVAMIAFAVHLARLAPARASRTEKERVSVGAGVGASGAGSSVVDTAVVDTVPAPSAGESGRDSVRASGPEAARGSGAVGMSLGWLAALLLVASIALRGFAVMRPPVANLFEFGVAGATATLLTYLIVAQRRPLRWLGLFVVIPVLSLLGIALRSWYVPAAELAPALDDYWIAIHVPIAIIAYGIFTVAFVVTVVHLFADRRERHRAEAGDDAVRPGLLDSLPNASRLDRIAYSLHVAAFPLWTFTIIAGAIWGQKAWGTYWSWDPKEAWSFVIWVLYAAYLHARATSGWKRRSANLIAIAGYVAILLNITVVNFYATGLHSYSGL